MSQSKGSISGGTVSKIIKDPTLGNIRKSNFPEQLKYFLLKIPMNNILKMVPRNEGTRPKWFPAEHSHKSIWLRSIVNILIPVFKKTG